MSLASLLPARPTSHAATRSQMAPHGSPCLQMLRRRTRSPWLRSLPSAALLALLSLGCDGDVTRVIGVQARGIAGADTLNVSGSGSTRTPAEQEAAAGGAGGSGGAASGGPAFACGGPVEPGVRVLELDVGGLSRRALVSAPAAFAADEPLPVVLGFHARDEDGGVARSKLELESATPVGWALFVYPDGPQRVFDGTLARGWQNGPATTYYGGTDDLAFIRLLIEALTEQYCIDQRGVFATGQGWGAEFASVVACYLGDRVSGVVSVAANTPYYLPAASEGDPPCVGSTAAWVMQGTGDEVFPVAFGREQVDFWAAANGCDPASAFPFAPTGASTADECVEYRCTGPDTRFCAYAAQWGHNAPRSFYPQASTDFFRALL